MNIKETLLRTLENGPEVLDEVKYAKIFGKDITLTKNNVEDIISKLHQNILNLEVIDKVLLNKDTVTLRFASVNRPLPIFQAGQYLNVFTTIEGVRTSRPYSISSSPLQRAYYEITVARVKDGFVSNYLIDEVNIGTKLEASSPNGVFYFNPLFHKKRSVFLAGGSGITPFMSMSREIIESNKDREVFLIYGCRNEKLALFNEELKSLQKKYTSFHYDLVISDDDNYKGRKGFINNEVIKDIVKDVDNATYYICGPQIMNDFCVQELKKLNVSGKNIRREMFGSQQNISLENGWPRDVDVHQEFNIKVGDKVIKGKAGESILTSLERNKIRVNVCCRSGECSLCRVQLKSGNVFISKGTLQRLADQKYNFIHSCKSYPLSDIEIIL